LHYPATGNILAGTG